MDDFTSRDAVKRTIVLDLFARTADENYITARWCAANDLWTDFLWLSVHAIEKYLKAVLLLNGLTTKNLQHNIVDMYDKVSDITADLYPKHLIKSEKLDSTDWRDEPSTAFIKRLYDHGGPSNRYGLYSYHTETQDLFKVDLIVFAIRRTMVPLNMRPIATAELTYKDMLTRHPNYKQTFNLPLDQLINSKDDTPLRNVALNLNLPFAPADYRHTMMRARFQARNSLLGHHIIDTLSSDGYNTATHALHVADWLLASVQLPKEAVREIDEARQIARKKHKL